MELLTDQVFEIVKVHTLVLKIFLPEETHVFANEACIYILSGGSCGAADESNCIEIVKAHTLVLKCL